MLSGNKRYMQLFLSFVEEDIPLVRPLAGALAAGGTLTVDYSLTTERFDAPESDYIRASLWNRIKRSAAALCLVGRTTLTDPWVAWSLQAAHQLDRRLLAASLTNVAQTSDQSEEAKRLLTDLGALIVPPRPEEILRTLSHADLDAGPHRDGPRLASLLHGLPTPFSLR